MVIAARNPVHSVLFLILAFVNAAGLFVLLGAEFLAMILVVVYVGAVAVLFLFVVMMLDVDFAELRAGPLQYLPIGVLIGGIFLAELLLVVGAWAIGPGVPQAITAPIPPPTMSEHRGARPRALHPLCLFLPGRRPDPAGRHDRRHRADAAAPAARAAARTSPSRSRARRRRRSKSSRCGRGRGWGAIHDHRPRTLSLGRRDPVHARDFRHLPQPQERHHHPDVDRADPAGGQHQSGRVLEPISATSSGRSSRCWCSRWRRPKPPSGLPSSSSTSATAARSRSKTSI